MINSLWRYSHFLLAAICALFLTLASVTGAILALEPIEKELNANIIEDLETISIAETVFALKKEYEEVLDLEITPENQVKVSVFTIDGNNENIYIHPKTGKKLGAVIPQSRFFGFITSLHRSLFLKGLGRAFVGVGSLLLCFIAITGIFLLAQRQGGFTNWFSNVKEKDFVQRYHVVLGRWFLLPVILIAVTGVYLSAEKFSLLPETNMSHKTGHISNITTKPSKGNDSLFQNTKLSDVRKLTFPFSEAPDDYFELALKDKELLVHQYTGDVLSELPYPFVQFFSRWSLQLHTGHGSVIWSIVLLAASLSLLFFMYSGFVMSWKRLRKSKKTITMNSREEAEFIILVGSETGNTYTFATTFLKALQKEGKSVYMTSLNEYDYFTMASHIIIFTSTYGNGDAPANARKFEEALQRATSGRPLQFSVVGFGSLLYPNYCQFAITVDNLLQSHPDFNQLLSLTKINEQSRTAFIEWVKDWNKTTDMKLNVELQNSKRKRSKEQFFTVIDRSSLNEDETVLLRLRPGKKIPFRSGDLLNVIPPTDSRIRQYSIARIDGDILLSVKLHPQGICSHYLCTLEVGHTLKASIAKNIDFYFPEDAPKVWMVANGTGIAPYLGMIHENKNSHIRLTWGGRTDHSFNCYKTFVEKVDKDKKRFDYELALSQSGQRIYVQDLLSNQQDEVIRTLKEGGVFMLCGSIAMQQGVLDTLEDITTTQLSQPLSDFEENGQILMDCY